MPVDTRRTRVRRVADVTGSSRARRALANFGEALASFNTHPTTATFREVQLAGRMLDDVRQTGAANGRDPGGSSPQRTEETVAVTLGQNPGLDWMARVGSVDDGCADDRR